MAAEVGVVVDLVAVVLLREAGRVERVGALRKKV